MDLGLSSDELALQQRAHVFAQESARPRAAARSSGPYGSVASRMLGWKLPQTRDGYARKSAIRNAAE